MSLQIKQSHSQIQFGSADSLTFVTYSSGAAENPTAATYVVYLGTEEKASGTASISTNTITVDLAGTEFEVPVKNAYVRLTVTTSSDSIVTNHIFDVVRYKLNNQVVDADLYAKVPKTQDKKWNGETNYYKQINDAFLEVLSDMRKNGYHPTAIVDSGQLNRAVIWKSLETIFFGFYRDGDDTWFSKYEESKMKYEADISSMVFDVDDSLDGTPGQESNLASIRCQR